MAGSAYTCRWVFPPGSPSPTHHHYHHPEGSPQVRKAKRAARSELSVSRGEWRKHGYASSPALLRTHGLVDGLPRVDASSLTAEEFAERYERPRQPVVLTGLCDAWPAAREWTLDRLLQRLGHCKFKVGWGEAGRPARGKPALPGDRKEGFKHLCWGDTWWARCEPHTACQRLPPHQGGLLRWRHHPRPLFCSLPAAQVGSDDDGYAVRLKLKHFLSYCRHPEHAPADDSPLYVFAHLDRDRQEGAALLQDYTGGRGAAAGATVCPPAAACDPLRAIALPRSSCWSIPLASCVLPGGSHHSLHAAARRL